MRIIHVVASLSKINFGVWNAAIFSSDYLFFEHGLKSELWVCADEQPMDSSLIPPNFFQKPQLSRKGIYNWLTNYNSKKAIIVTHGAWLTPTKIGFYAEKKGFRWIYTPHGMSEPWALKPGFNLKWIYFKFFEQSMIKRASAIRAVSKSEQDTLSVMLRRDIALINNGVKNPAHGIVEKNPNYTYFLFMARLHSKKGIIFLIKAWNNTLKNNHKFKLIIAGPDEGELKKIEPYLCSNIEYLGPQYGKDKIALLRKSHYYVLPSYSEGFPTSVVEAMSYGAIPIISEGCNFPEVFKEKIGFRIEPNEESIRNVLKDLSEKKYDVKMSLMNIEYIIQNLTERTIGEDMLSLYKKVGS